MENLNLHIGWNGVEIKRNKIFKDIKNKSHMYFIFDLLGFVPEDKSSNSATTIYSSKIMCSRERKFIWCSFHPEKSDKTGQKTRE